jgi:hypothetical protein
LRKYMRKRTVIRKKRRADKRREKEDVKAVVE